MNSGSHFDAHRVDNRVRILRLLDYFSDAYKITQNKLSLSIVA